MPSFIHSMDAKLWLLPVQRATILAGMAEPYTIRINVTSWQWHEVSISLVSFVLIQARERNSGLYSPNAFKPIRPPDLLQRASTLCRLKITLPLVVEWKKLTEGVAIERNLPYALDKKHTQNAQHREEKGTWKIKAIGKRMLKTEEEQQWYRSIKDEKDAENGWHRVNVTNLRTG